MTDNTALDEVSRGVPEEQVSSAKQDAERRAATMDKVIVRMKECTERLVLINTAVGAVLTDMIAKDALGAGVDYLTAFDDQVKALEDAHKALAGRVSYAKEVTMPERMDAEECSTFNTESNRITRTSRVFASILGPMQEAAFAWLRKNNYDALIKETVNSSSLSAAAKELITLGKELPEDMFATHVKDGVSITRKKK